MPASSALIRRVVDFDGSIKCWTLWFTLFKTVKSSCVRRGLNKLWGCDDCKMTRRGYTKLRFNRIGVDLCLDAVPSSLFSILHKISVFNSILFLTPRCCYCQFLLLTRSSHYLIPFLSRPTGNQDHYPFVSPITRSHSLIVSIRTSPRLHLSLLVTYLHTNDLNLWIARTCKLSFDLSSW